MTADRKLVEALHSLLATEFTTLLTHGRKVINKETGEVDTISLDAATLGQIRQFIKDNGVEALAAPNSPLAKLVDSLPVFPDDPALDETQPN